MEQRQGFEVGGYVRAVSDDVMEPGRIESVDDKVIRVHWEISESLTVYPVAMAAEWLTPIDEGTADALFWQTHEINGRLWHAGNGVVHEDYTYILGRKDKHPPT